MRGIVLLDHFHTGAAVLGDLVDIGPFHEPQAYISVPQAIGSARPAVAVKLQPGPLQYPVKQLQVIAGEHGIGQLRQFDRQWRIGVLLAPVSLLLAAGGLRPVEQPLIGPDRTRHALTEPDATLAADLDLQDFLSSGVIGRNGDVAVLQVLRFIRPEPGVPHEQDKIVNLLGIPSILRLCRFTRVLPAGLIEFFVFVRAEPRAMHDFTLGLVRRRQFWRMAQPAMPDRRLQHQAQRDDLIMERTARRRLALFLRRRLDPMDPVVLGRAGRYLGQAHVPEEREQMQPQPRLVAGDPFWGALALGDDLIFAGEFLRGVLDRLLGPQEPGARFSGFFEIPVLGDLLRQTEALLPGTGAILPAADGGRALPVLTPGALKDLQIAVHELVCRHAHLPSMLEAIPLPEPPVR